MMRTIKMEMAMTMTRMRGIMAVTVAMGTVAVPTSDSLLVVHVLEVSLLGMPRRANL